MGLKRLSVRIVEAKESVDQIAVLRGLIEKFRDEWYLQENSMIGEMLASAKRVHKFLSSHYWEKAQKEMKGWDKLGDLDEIAFSHIPSWKEFMEYDLNPRLENDKKWVVDVQKELDKLIDVLSHDLGIIDSALMSLKRGKLDAALSLMQKLEDVEEWNQNWLPKAV